MTDLASLSDDALFRRSRAGDEEAFATLYRRRQGAVYRFALQMSGSDTTAEEVTQETFLALIRGGWEPARGPLEAWLIGVARRQVLRRLKRDCRYLPVEDDAPQPPMILDDLTRGEALEALRQAVLALPAQYREVVVLCDIQEISYEEAARVLDCAVGTVRSRLHRGRALLARKLRSKVECLP